MKIKRISQNFLTVFIVFFPFSFSVRSQVVPDRTLGSESSQIIRNQSIKGISSDLIQGGATRGSTLFHSLQQMQIQQERGAYFVNPSGISNIITRITGVNPTNINGTLGVLGNANFILLSPRGINLGNGANFDINGSISLTTASDLFINNLQFSATNPRNIPFGITIDIAPIGGFINPQTRFKFDNNSSSINLINQGHELQYQGFSLNSIRGRNPALGIELKQDQNFTLLGNNIKLDGGILTAESGNIKIGAIKDGIIFFNSDNSLNLNSISKKGNIKLSNRSLIDVSSPDPLLNLSNIGSGSVQMVGENISFSDNSLILNYNRGRNFSGNIDILAENQLNFMNSLTNPNSISLLSITEDGIGSDINLISNNIYIQNTSLLTQVNKDGIGGDININSNNLNISRSGGVATISLIGQGGDLNINSKNNIFIDGITSPLSPDDNSLLISSTLGFGNGGDLNLTTNSVKITNGARIGSTVNVEAFANLLNPNGIFRGKGGDVNINVKNIIEVIGSSPTIFINPSDQTIDTKIPSSIRTGTFGGVDAGNLFIVTDNLLVRNGAIISSSSSSNANSGNLNIISLGSIDLDGGTIQTATIKAEENFRQSVNLPVRPSGRAGNLIIDANRINLNEGEIISTSFSGNGGNIDVNANTLFLRDNSLISSTAFGDDSGSNGGNININADLTILLNSNIFARAVRGRGGDISISGSGVFLDSFSSIDASSQFGQDGTITIDVPQSLRTLVGGITKPSEIIVSVTKSLEICPEGKVRRGKFKVGTGTSTPYTPKNKIDRYELIVEDIPTPLSGSDDSQQAQIPFILTHPESYEPGFFYPAPNVGVRFPDGRTAVATEGYARPKTLEELICQPPKLPKDF